MADRFVLETPKGELIKIQTPEGKFEMQIRWNPCFGSDMTRMINNMQEFVDSECLRFCDNLVPKDTGILKQSGIMHTQIGSGELKYRTPYARKWYYMPANFSEAPMRGNYWFERMKQQRKAQILAGAKRIANRG